MRTENTAMTNRPELKEIPPIVELRTVGGIGEYPPHGRCGGCGSTLVEGEEYLYDKGFLLCEGCLDVEYPVVATTVEELDD